MKSQIILHHGAKVKQTTPVSFILAEFTDSLASRKIGVAYLADEKSTTPIQLSQVASQFLKKVYTNQFSAANTSDSILINIKSLRLTEQKNGTILEGKLAIELTYTSINNELLVTKETTSSYKRTFGSATPNVFQEVLNQAFTRNINFFNLWLNQNRAFHPALITESEVIIRPPHSTNVPDTIYYETRSISWEDFTGEPNTEGNRYAAAIFPNIAFELEMKIQNRKLIAYFTPKVYMVQGLSWVKNFNKNAYALEHEQLHFDVAKIAMNRMVKRLPEIKATSPDDLQSRIQFEYLETYREMNRLQDAYDKETGHGINQSMQSFWKSQISDWLKE